MILQNMYSIVGLCFADEVFNNTLNISEPFGAIIIVSIHINLEDAQRALENQKSLSTKSPVPLIYTIFRLGAIKVLKMSDDKKEITPPENPMPDSPILPKPSELEELATSFSTLIHSLGVRDHSQKLMEQALGSIPVRIEEVKTLLNKDPTLYNDLISYYDFNLVQGSPIHTRIMQFLTDVDENGLPNCLNL